MFRKSILILLIAVMILTSACGKDKSQDEAKEKQMPKGSQIHGLLIEN